MSMTDERNRKWAIPAFIVAIILVLFIAIRFGGWIVYGIQTAGTKRDIVISLDQTLDRFQTSQSRLGYYVDLDKKLIVMEVNDYSTPGNKYEALKFLNSSKKKVLKKASLSEDDVKLLLEIANPKYIPASQKDKVRKEYLQNMQRFKLEYNTDRISDIYAEVEVYRYDIETILDNFEESSENEVDAS